MKIIKTLFFFCISMSSLAQVHTDQNGNVGIGTSTPGDKLEVSGNLTISNSTDNGNIGGRITLRHATKAGQGLARDWAIYNMSGIYGNSLQFWAYDDLGCVSGGLCDLRMTLSDNGNLGLGTGIPESRFHLVQNENQIGMLLQSSSAGWGSGMVFRNTAAGGRSYGLYSSEWGGFHVVDQTGGIGRMYFSPNGNVGIGTSQVNDPAFRLFVESGIRTRKIKVDQNTWADFVFAPSYQLRPLNEVKAFIKEHQHLPDVPSEKDILATGVDLGEMNKILLQKIEELTLYLIEQQELQQNQDSTIQHQASTIQELNRRNEELEKVMLRLSDRVLILENMNSKH